MIGAHQHRPMFPEIAIERLISNRTNLIGRMPVLAQSGRRRPIAHVTQRSYFPIEYQSVAEIVGI